MSIVEEAIHVPLPSHASPRAEERVEQARFLETYAVLALPSAAALMATGMLGPYTPAFGRLGLICLLGIHTWLARRSVGLERPWIAKLLLVAPLLPVPLALAASGGGRQTDLIALVVVCVMCALATQDRPGAGGFRTVAWAVAVFATVDIASQYSTLVWWGLEGLAEWLSWMAGGLVHTRLHLGPTPAAVWGLVLAYAMVLPPRPGAWDRVRARALPVLIYLLTGVVLAIILIAAQPALEGGVKALAQAILTPPHSTLGEADQPGRLPPGFFAPLGTVLLLAVLLPWGQRLGAIDLSGASASPPPAARAWVGVLLLAGGSGVIATQPQAQPSTGVVALYDEGFFDLSRPERGRYGLIQAGMYGSLKELLVQSGYAVRSVGSADLRAGLGGVSTLVIINPKQQLDPETHDTVWRFVREGGGLLVLGDHTDLFGIMDPLNDLLSPVGIRFEFDSAFPLRTHWQHSLDIRPHPMTAGLRDATDVQIGTGASLKLSSAQARPVILGRHAFGDYGNRLNEGRGGLLGDYRYQLGERLGDLVLVASADAGEGRVVVFGDTSSFQVLGVPFSHEFLRHVFAYLANPAPSRLWSMMLGVLLCASGIGLWVRWGGGPAHALPLVAALAVGGAGAVLIPSKPLPPLASPESVAVVDARHSPAYAFEFFSSHSYGGLFTTAQRAGFLPLVDRGGWPTAIDGARLALFLAPSRPPSAEDLAALERLLARGGKIFVAAGGRDKLGPANAILKLCGLRIEPVPLGPVQYRWEDLRVDFFDAWAVSAEDPARASVRAESHGFAVVMESDARGGRCIAVGDHRFLDDQRFEGENQFHEANIRFMDALLSGEVKP